MARPRSKPQPQADLSRIQVRLGRAAWPGLVTALTASGDPGVSDRVRHLLTLGALAEQAGLAVAGPPAAPVLVQLGGGAAPVAQLAGRRESPPSPAAQSEPTIAAGAAPAAAGRPEPQVRSDSRAAEQADAAAHDGQESSDEAALPLTEAGSALLESLGIG